MECALWLQLSLLSCNSTDLLFLISGYLGFGLCCLYGSIGLLPVVLRREKRV
jgi:hypothetical protein